MTIKRPQWPSGHLARLEFESTILQGNPLGDPTNRPLHVWLPPQYERNEKKRFPVLYDLVGYTGSGLSHTNWRSFEENIPERAARLIHQRKMGPCILVFPDCFTALGGNQYINSAAIGRYADYLTREIIPFVDQQFRTLASRDHRGCFGKSSGGYGAIIHAMKYSQYWGAIADHSGDACFDLVYRSDFPATLNTLARFRSKPYRTGVYDVLQQERGVEEGMDDGRIRRFLEHIWQQDKLTNGEVECLMMLGMAATYDPDPDAPNGFRMPFNLETGEIIMPRWRRWLRHDPTLLVERYQKNLTTLKGIYIDCGWRDQYHIHFGSRILSKRLQQCGIQHHYEEFDDDHSGIDYRLDHSLPFLYRALKPWHR